MGDTCNALPVKVPHRLVEAPNETLFTTWPPKAALRKIAQSCLSSYFLAGFLYARRQSCYGLMMLPPAWRRVKVAPDVSTTIRRTAGSALQAFE